MTDIVGEIGALLDYLSTDPDGIGTARRPIHLSGHSAGGHLTAVHRAHPAVVSALAISPLVDLEPISLCVLNDRLQLTAHEIAAYSPLRHIGPGAPTEGGVGAAELPELVRHAHEYAHACEAAGERIARAWLPSMQHFTVLDDLATPDSAMLAALQAIAPR
jgi:acetyl esterase/lipase